VVCRPSPRATGRQRTRLSTPLRGTARLPTTALKTTLYVGASIGADRGPSMHVGDVIACGPSSPSCTVVVVIGGFHNPRQSRMSVRRIFKPISLHSVECSRCAWSRKRRAHRSIDVEHRWNPDGIAIERRSSPSSSRDGARARATARDETARHGTARVVGRDGTRIGT